MFIHEKRNWTNFRWDEKKIAFKLNEVARRQGLLYGKLSSVGFDNRLQTMAENLTHDLVHSSEIEGIRLNSDEVRSSIARRLGIATEKSIPSSHYIDGVVAVMLDAMEHYDQPLTKQRLCAWQTAFFPATFSEGHLIEVGRYRTHDEYVVSGFLGRERVHYIAPAPNRVEHEMQKFIDWFNSAQPISPIVRSAIAHFWFVSIHPFEDGNGRLARILGDIFLSRADCSQLRFYNIASEINRDKKHYYSVLERTQRSKGDITEWLDWYIDTLQAAIATAENLVSSVLNKANFWIRASRISMNERQTATLNRFLDGYEAKITTKTWAELNKCSTDTANRDIQNLIQKGILHSENASAKRPSYAIIFTNNDEAIIDQFSDVKVEKSGKNFYLTAKFQGKTQVRERILTLDANRYERGEIALQNLLAKYCNYLITN